VGVKSVGPHKGMFYPSFTGTLTYNKLLETFVRALCHRIRMFCNSESFFSFGEDEYDELHHQVT
jgi:hypothetical protein